MKLTPTFQKIIVLPDPTEEKTAGGLFIPEVAKERPTWGTVIAVGPECECVQQGDRVVFGKYSGSDLEQGGQKIIIMREDDVIAFDADVRSPAPRTLSSTCPECHEPNESRLPGATDLFDVICRNCEREYTVDTEKGGQA